MVASHLHNLFLIAAWIGYEPLEEACLQPVGWTMLVDPKKMNTANGAFTDLSATSRQRLNPLYSLIHVQGKMEFSITGKIKQTQVFGPSFELKRTLSGTLGHAAIRIQDEVTNCANTPAPHMLLYHLNFGWPLADVGADILWNGPWQFSGDKNAAKIFREGNNFRKCPSPLPSHNGTGEEVAFIDIDVR